MFADIDLVDFPSVVKGKNFQNTWKFFGKSRRERKHLKRNLKNPPHRFQTRENAQRKQTKSSHGKALMPSFF